jgi:hypothetical protein
MTSREKALATVLAQQTNKDKLPQLKVLLSKATMHLAQVITINDVQNSLNQQALDELSLLVDQLATHLGNASTWGEFLEQNQLMNMEAQEILIACLMELYPEQVDVFADQMNTDETLFLATGKKVSDLISLLEARYQWAVSTDFSMPENSYWFWYRSQDKEEPRLGVREEEQGADKELPLDIGRQAYYLYRALRQQSQDMSIAQFLLHFPQYRAIARRVWTLGNRVMGDIQMNLLHKQSLPIHLLRCKLAIFGATKFDPRSDRWVRVTFFQGAPLLDEIGDENYQDNWIFPLLPSEQSMTSINSITP